jgi:hypothetical protein
MALPDMFTTTYTNEMIDEWLGIKKENNNLSITTVKNEDTNSKIQNDSKNLKEITK